MPSCIRNYQCVHFVRTLRRIWWASGDDSVFLGAPWASAGNPAILWWIAVTWVFIGLWWPLRCCHVHASTVWQFEARVVEKMCANISSVSPRLIINGSPEVVGPRVYQRFNGRFHKSETLAVVVCEVIIHFSRGWWTCVSLMTPHCSNIDEWYSDGHDLVRKWAVSVNKTDRWDVDFGCMHESLFHKTFYPRYKKTRVTVFHYHISEKLRIVMKNTSWLSGNSNLFDQPELFETRFNWFAVNGRY